MRHYQIKHSSKIECKSCNIPYLFEDFSFKSLSAATISEFFPNIKKKHIFQNIQIKQKSNLQFIENFPYVNYTLILPSGSALITIYFRIPIKYHNYKYYIKIWRKNNGPI